MFSNNPYLKKAVDYPRTLIVDIHSYCNGRCTMCPYPKLSRRQSQGKMEWALYKSIINEFSQLGRKHNFTPAMTYCYMGEPFLAENLEEYVSYALERQVGVYLNTNAAAMNREKVDALLKTGFRGKIHISFHGITPEVYERITGLNYQETLANTLYLIEKYGPQNILIRGVDDNWPEGEYAKWRQYWQARQVQLEYLAPISRAGLLKRLLPGQKKHRNYKRLYGCRRHLPLVEMVILFDGRVVMCCQDMARTTIWGDVAKDGLAGVWNGPVRRKLVQQLYGGVRMPQSFICCQCEEALGLGGLVASLGREFRRKLTTHTTYSQGRIPSTKD